MKRIIIFFLLILSAQFLPAQVISPRNFVKERLEWTRINLLIDYSEVRIMGIPEEDFTAFEDHWDLYKPTFFKYFAYGINEQTARYNNAVFGHFENADYTLVFKVLDADEDGDMNAEAYFYRKGESTPFLSITEIASDGNGSNFWNATSTLGAGVSHGSFSAEILSFTALGFHHAGAKLGEILDKKILK